MPKAEDTLFAMCESKLLLSNNSEIDSFISVNFKPFSQPRKDIALQNYYRFDYLTNSYRLEKWLYRESFVQISENYHLSLICFAHFLYAINKSYIPRDDWKIYLLFELEIKPDNLEKIITTLQSGVKDESEIKPVQEVINTCKRWMGQQTERFGW